MKTTMLACMLTAGLALGNATVSAQETPEAPAPPHAPFGPPPHAIGPGKLLLGAIAKYDANQDGQLDATEIATLRADAEAEQARHPRGPRGPVPPHAPNPPGFPPPEILTQYDVNSDGHLDETEHATLKADVEAGKISPPPPPPVPHLRPTVQSLLERFDADGNGSLDSTELQALVNAAPRPERGLRHRPGPPMEQSPNE